MTLATLIGLWRVLHDDSSGTIAIIATERRINLSAAAAIIGVFRNFFILLKMLRKKNAPRFLKRDLTKQGRDLMCTKFTTSICTDGTLGCRPLVCGDV